MYWTELRKGTPLFSLVMKYVMCFGLSAVKVPTPLFILVMKYVMCFGLSAGKVGGGPTPFLYMATRFLANVHVQNVQNVQKLFFPVWKFPGKIYLLLCG